MAARQKIVVQGRTQSQKEYLNAIENSTFTFGIGPAGVGKTYLAVACAMQALKAKRVDRIIIVRPAVESGEHLGFLPGTYLDKLSVYMMPIFDAMKAWVTPEELQHMIEVGTIEVAALAYMRGRNLSKSFIIVDEAQNTTPEQMIMMLTRLSNGSKMVINGDLSQIDLPGYGLARSGLYCARDLLQNQISGVNFVEFDHSDVIRHPVVKSIVELYNKKAFEREMREDDFVPASPNGNGNH